MTIRPYAGLGARLAAYLLDVLIAVLFTIIPAYVITRILIAAGVWTPAVGHAHSISRGLSRLLIAVAFFLSTGPVYFVLCHASPWQATFGKRLLNIYVTDDNGNRIGLARSLVRGLALWFLNAFALGLLSLVTIAASERRKGMHDFAARTVVLSGRPSTAGALESWRVAACIGIPVAWMLATLFATI